MSLPPAPKDISTNPAPGSVVDPVNKDAKDADVSRKIGLYGIIQAFRQGRLPDNAQIDSALKYVLDHSPVDVSRLSQEGKRLISDTRDIIETARVIVNEKNKDELFQYFFWHTRDMGLDPKKVKQKVDGAPEAPASKDRAKDDGQQAILHLRTLLALILTNSEVRKLLSDFSLIGRDLLARGASQAATKIGPDDEKMAKVDDPGPRGEFVEGGDLSKEVQGYKERALGLNGKVQAQVHAQSGAEEARYDAPEEEKKRVVADKFRSVRDELVDPVPQEHKDKASEQYDRGKRFFTEEYFPEERRDQYIYRCKKVIIECQKHEDYQESLNWLLSFLSEYASHGRYTANRAADHVATVSDDHALNQATTELRTLLQRFANGQSPDIVFDALNVLIDDANRDEELKDLFGGVQTHARKVLLEPGYLLEDRCNDEANKLRESGRRFYDEKYKGHFDNLFASIGNWFKAIGDDPLNKRLGEDWARLTKDLLFDREGSLKFKKHLWLDIRKVIMPTLVDEIGYIPVPRIEYTDENLDLVLENLTLSGRNLFPNAMSFEAHNFLKFSPYDAIDDVSHHEFTFTFTQVQADMRDIAFYFRRKTGMPKMTDSGLADVVLGGRGLSATVHLVSADKDKSSVFKVKSVIVHVDAVKFSIRDSKHDTLYKVIKPLATGLVKMQVQRAVQRFITTSFEYIDGQLVTVRDRMSEAKANDGDSPTKALQELFAHKEKAMLKASETTRGAQFNVVSSKSQSLVNVGHPAGWVNRTTEREEKALEGKEWRSEAFTVV